MIIGISGKLGSGKDTLADFLLKLLPVYEKKSFAIKIKEIAAILSNTSIKNFSTQRHKEEILPYLNITKGNLLQKIGNGLRNVIDEDIWIQALFNSYTINKNWIISDLRYKNEAITIKQLNGILIRIDGDPINIRKNSTRNLTHSSEIDLDDYTEWDYKYINNKSLKNLQEWTYNIVKNNPTMIAEILIT